MVDYKKMYVELFNAATKAINILQKFQQSTEEMYISGDDAVIDLLPKDGNDKNRNGDTSE